MLRVHKYIQDILIENFLCLCENYYHRKSPTGPIRSSSRDVSLYPSKKIMFFETSLSYSFWSFIKLSKRYNFRGIAKKIM